MKITKLIIALIIIAVITLIASACAGGQAPLGSDLFPASPVGDQDQPVESGNTNDPAPGKDEQLAGDGSGEAQSPPEMIGQPGFLPRDMEGDLPEEIAEKVKEALRESHSFLPEEVTILHSEGYTWSDSCMGLGKKNESCLNVMVHGWRVELQASGGTFVARTNENGESIRFEDGTVSPDGPGTPPPAVFKAIDALSEKLGSNGQGIALVSWSSVDWPNGCLGLAGPDEMCTQALVPGWKVELEVDGTIYIARTDAMGDQIRFEE